MRANDWPTESPQTGVLRLVSISGVQGSMFVALC
jgi:hypothetical protein